MVYVMTLSEYEKDPGQVLEAVRRGETVELTAQGKPVAHVIPADSPDARLRELAKAGRVQLASRAVPIPPPPGGPRLSDEELFPPGWRE